MKILEDLGDKIQNSNPLAGGLNFKQIINSKINKISDKNQLLIIKAIQSAGEPLSIDEIIKITKLEPHLVSQAIAFLTIAGIIKETEKGYSF